MNREQKKFDDRIKEIKEMSNKQLVWALVTEGNWEYQARRDMRNELADNTYKDMELLKLEILGRMIEPRRPGTLGYHDVAKFYENPELLPEVKE